MTQINVLSGSRTIGGTFIRIDDGERALVFDQGIRFDIFRRYYTEWITPLGVMELRRLGILPKEEWYERVQDIYITHLHLDHLGALSNIPKPIPVHIPGGTVYEEIARKRWERSPSWLNIIPESYYIEIQDVQPLSEDKNGVLPIPVSHSAFPAMAYLYFGKDKTVLYTGDIRVNGYLDKKGFKKLRGGPSLLEYIANQRDIHIDVLLIEGTNFGSDRMPISPKDSLEIIERILTHNDQVIVTTHYLDVEFLLSVVKLAQDLDRRCYILSEVVAKILHRICIDPKISVVEEFAVIPEYSSSTLQEVFEEPSILILSYYEIVDLCRKVGKAALQKNIASIITEPEPAVEEMVEYEIVNRWLLRSGIQPYRLRVSGHYYPFEIGEILKTIKPKQVISIHTEHPELMQI
ncbi:MAG: MBL fold metallo-hydrolase, partial [Candidatus Bathycorpusculaceae bacterium]